MEDFDGKKVVGSEVRVVKAGDGLSDALELDPREYPHGSEITLVLRGTVTQVNYKPPKKGHGADTLVRVHTLTTTHIAEATDAGTPVATVLDQAEATVRAAAEARKKAELEASGVFELGDDGDDEEDPWEPDEEAIATAAAALGEEP